MPVYNVNPVNTVPKDMEFKETVPRKSASAFPKGTCPHCGKTDHLAKDCWYIKAKCHYCHKTGHLESVCMKKKKGRINLISEEKPVQKVNCILGNDPARLTLQINGKSFMFEVNNGAKDNFCSKQIWATIFPRIVYMVTINFER